MTKTTYVFRNGEVVVKPPRTAHQMGLLLVGHEAAYIGTLVEQQFQNIRDLLLAWPPVPRAEFRRQYIGEFPMPEDEEKPHG